MIKRALLVGFLLGGWIPAAQIPSSRKPDASARLIAQYRDYPDRYLRLSKESWVLNEQKGSATHTFTLTNTAAITYWDIQIRFRYQDAAGKELRTQTLKVMGSLGPARSSEVKSILVKGVPARSEIVTLSVAKASVLPPPRP
jgi:hypothetical protein